jgi:hypothetical protein
MVVETEWINSGHSIDGMLEAEARALIERRLDRLLTPRGRSFQDFLRSSLLAAGPEGTFVRSQRFAVEEEKRATDELEKRADIAWEAIWEVLDARQEAVSVAGIDEAVAIAKRRLEVDEKDIRAEASHNLIGFGHSNSLDGLASTVRKIHAEWEDFVELTKLKRGRNRADILRLFAPRYSGPNKHWEKAKRYSDGSAPDWENAAKEAMSCVEGLAQIVADARGTKLGKCLETLRARGQLSPAVVKAVEAMYGHSSNLPGVRHGSAEDHRLPAEDAIFVVEFCAAAVRLLLAIDDVQMKYHGSRG